MRAAAVVAALLALLLPAAGLADFKAASTEAYVTLLYSDQYVLGVRVLGESLKESGTTKDMVVLVTGPLSASAEVTLMTDGWKVKRVHPVQNPGKGPQESGFPPRFWAVYTKLLIFQLTEYHKVVFLDADTLVTRNVDVLFGCPGFCAALRHSERFNTGVMSLVPSQELFDDMMGKVHAMPSYTGGDQGFLNSYFSGFAHSPLFDPATVYTADQYKYMRLPTSFNADIGLYVVNSNRWMIPRESIYVIHFTLGTFKPWVWWTSWLVGENAVWQAYRQRLPADSLGLLGAKTHRQIFAERWLSAVPVLLLLYCCWRYWPSTTWHASSWRHQLTSGHSKHAHPLSAPHTHPHSPASIADTFQIKSPRPSLDHRFERSPLAECFPRMFLLTSLSVGYLSVVLGVVVAVAIVPPEVSPVVGWVLTYEWALLVFGLCYGKFLQLCYRWGQQSGGHGTAVLQHKTVQLPWMETIVAAVTVALCTTIAPWVGRLLGVHSFIGNVFVTFGSGVAANMVLMVQLIFLPSQWYSAGMFMAARYE